MEFLKAEVKTIYQISVSADDYANAKNKWLHNEVTNARFPKAFTMENQELGHVAILMEMKNHFSAHGDNAGCLADYLGFDGWDNAGYFDESTMTIKMTVFDYGNRMNFSGKKKGC